MKSYKVEVSIYGEDCDTHGWHGNALRFETWDEANAYGSDLMGRWTLAADYRVVFSNEPVNYKFVNGRAERITDNGAA